MKKRNLLYILPLVFAVGCEPEFDDVDFNKGTADFSKTVALGNSLTAGYQSSALSLAGQENSLPEILAKQFALVGGGEFKTPFLSGEAGARGAGVSAFAQGFLTPALALLPGADCRGETSLGPKLNGNPYPVGNNFASIAGQGPFNNVGVPGAKLVHLNVVGYGSSQGNPYFARFAVNPGQTMINHAMSVNATFFTLWIGNNDVLGYSTGGGEESNETITGQATFTSLYAATVDSLMKNGAKGAVANIPSITSIPYFNTVPAKIIPITRQSQADSANGAYAQYNNGLENVVLADPTFRDEADRRKIKFVVGANYMVTTDPDLRDLSAFGLPNLRQMVAGELLTLTTPTDSIKCFGYGTKTPMPGRYVLLSAEIEKISAAVTGYNTTIKSIATAEGLAYVDANAKLKEVESGLKFNGTEFTTEFARGGAFSYDGVHPTTRGYALIANTFIEAINNTYNANVPRANVNDYPNQ
jgi:hypothetical protein